MELSEKLQELRKGRGLTQEELAEALYVSRTAVSKWESGRGYPSIDSLKELSKFFSVTIDDLLSGEKLLSLAEQENQSNIQRVCDLLIGMTDLFSFLLIVLPLYPKTVDGFVYAVNLFAYTDATVRNRTICWVLFLALVLIGLLKLFLAKQHGDIQKMLTRCSLVLSSAAVMFLALAGETYAVAVVFSLLLVKGLLLYRCLHPAHP